MMNSQTVIVDASLCLSLVLDFPSSQRYHELWTGWLENDVEIATPQLWLYEVTSAIHKIYLLKQVSEASTLVALEAILALDVHLVDADANLCRSAFG